jgi:glycosyltransferase involved in cell wall biosynthesis
MLNLTAYVAARLVGAKFIAEIVGILHDPYIVTNTDEPEGNLRNPIRLATRASDLVREIVAGRLQGLWTNFVCHMPTARADIVIAINDDEKRWIKKIYGRDAERIYWCTPKNIEEASEAPKADIPKDFLFFIGQIKRRKGWDTAIEAIAALKQKGVDKHLVFVTPQKSFEEPLGYAAKLGVSDRITFLSSISNGEKNWLYTHASCVLIPSRYEGFGLPVFEAFLARKPVIATKIVVFEEFLKDGENALLIPIGDAEALAQVLIRLDNSDHLRQRLVEGGTRTAASFEAPVMVEQYVRLF